MVLLLHQVESLKSFVLGSIRSTDKIFRNEKEERLPGGTKKLFAKVWVLLVKENILAEEESEDIQRIIEIRNEIGHSIHNLVSDISAKEFGSYENNIYDYYALDRFERYREKIQRGMQKKFVLQVGFTDLAFEEAEKTYKEELERLNKKIQRQYAERKRKRA